MTRRRTWTGTWTLTLRLAPGSNECCRLCWCFVDVQDIVNGLAVKRKFDAPEFSRYQNEIAVRGTFGEEFEVDALVSQLHEGKDWRLCI